MPFLLLRYGIPLLKYSINEVYTITKNLDPFLTQQSDNLLIDTFARHISLRCHNKKITLGKMMILVLRLLKHHLPTKIKPRT
jgi:hypothetical protein